MSLNDYATKIQAFYRGYRERKVLDKAKIEYYEICKRLNIEPNCAIPLSSKAQENSQKASKKIENPPEPFTQEELQKTRNILLAELAWVQQAIVSRIDFLETKPI